MTSDAAQLFSALFYCALLPILAMTALATGAIKIQRYGESKFRQGRMAEIANRPFSFAKR